jgi:hypothetical protein
MYNEQYLLYLAYLLSYISNHLSSIFLFGNVFTFKNSLRLYIFHGVMENQKTHMTEESFLKIYQLYLFKIIRNQFKHGPIVGDEDCLGGVL